VNWALHFLGVGNAAAADSLGSASAVIECNREPLLLIDCGQEALAAYVHAYSGMPLAVFITHVHMDHVAGLERLFFAARFDPQRCGRVRLYVPAALVPYLQARVADYPGVLAEGGSNFWDAFQLIPVSRGFWHRDRWYDVFEVRHHAPGTAFGLRLRGALVYSGDTRPIPEVLAYHADERELIAHDCALVGNPSHSGLDDLEREYSRDLLDRLLIYHYGSAAEADAMEARGFSVARAGQHVALSTPTAPQTRERS
jgi:glyoxylase-like metal-dependent hydrolase (beta-lactamase superfamily II)